VVATGYILNFKSINVVPDIVLACVPGPQGVPDVNYK